MIEDDIYRTSSQYHYWSYTQEALTSLRQNTNNLASERVRAAMKRSQTDKKAQNGELAVGHGVKAGNKIQENQIETLTVEEELQIIRWGCSKIVDMGQVMEPPIPMEIRATAIQYLRRFYLSNSPMTYHPKQIMMCALFLATKSDHWHISLSNFVSKLPNTIEDDIKAPEFLLMQGLRFTLDVRHPMRGLEGGVGEILTLVEDGLLGVTEKDRRDAKRRVGEAAERASDVLRTAAQVTDAYFLYTPSQIWLAALLLADRDLITLYIKSKLMRIGGADEGLREKLLLTLTSCAKLLASDESEENDPAEKKVMSRIGRKLHICQNPEKIDLVAVTKAKAAQKREGTESDAEMALKKRKMEREKLARDGDVFGPDLTTVSG